MTAGGSEQGRRGTKYLLGLSLAALGVVYGDIGTSPLYALRESFHAEHGLPVSPENILGILSLVFWSLIIVISIKYLVFILRADNRGEGGILALTALVTPVSKDLSTQRKGLILLGIFGTALLYGDGMITPAISVLSAVEGLDVATPVFSPYIIPITVVILIGLFAIQSHGTARIGKIFGPVMLVWFIVLGLLGLAQIVRRPEVLAAVWPGHAFHFFARNHWHGFLVLGSVFLVVTGGEALYSDLGHFGKSPIRIAWFSLVLPALVLNYFGQGALLLQDPEAIRNPFFLLAPRPLLIPMVVLSAVATVIASQALITGVFSLSMQATQLGYTPRVLIRHTSHEEKGQIYVGGMNWTLLVACVALVLGFRSSSNLAAAYGLAVTTTMVITTLLFYVVARKCWHWPRIVTMALCGTFLVVDVAFWGANLVKIPHGGWFPLLIGAFGFTIMSTWKRGRQLLGERLREKVMPLSDFITRITKTPPQRVQGTAIFLSSNPSGTPPALVHILDHFHALHQTLVLLSVRTEEIPHVPPEERRELKHLGDHIYGITLRYGFMEEPDVHQDIAGTRLDDGPLQPDNVTYILGRESLIATRRPGMAIWREKLFATMSRNASSAAEYFRLPAERVVEVGIQVEL